MDFRAVSLLHGSRSALMRLIVRLSINLPFISASRRRGFSRNAGLLRLIMGSAAFAAAAGFAPARSAETVLYSFKCSNDTAGPAGSLISDGSGALYGTTIGGNASAFGAVFKLTPPGPEHLLWTETVLYDFKNDGKDGIIPSSGLIFDSKGALYGTTSNGGGPSGFGTVFKLTPPAAGQTQWTETVLYRFKVGNDGATPLAGLIFDSKGALYGTTEMGGTLGFGTVFKLVQ